MKKLIIFIFITFSPLLFISPHKTFADTSTYARITQSGIYIYSTPNENDGLFTVPQSYFVKIIGELDDFYYVSYLNDTAPFKEIKGYCKKSQVELVDYTPNTPFLEYKIKVTYSVGESIPNNPLSSYTLDAVYYGEFNFGTSVYYYVNINGEFGYVPQNSASEVNYPINTERTPTQTQIPENVTNKTSQNNAVRIVLICALSVFAIGAVYFLFKPQRIKTPPNPFYDETENY